MRVVVGDLWEEEGLKVVPSNYSGPMGRGVARQAADRYPGLERLYKDACARKVVPPVWCPGAMPRVRLQDKDYSLIPPVILLAVKNHWRDKADPGLIAAGLDMLVDRWERWGRPQIALPLLGCGFGELRMEDVLPLMARTLIWEQFTLVLPDEEVGEKYAATLRPGARADRRWATKGS